MAKKTSMEVTSLSLPTYRFNEDPLPPLQRTGAGRVYPYPRQDDLTDELVDKSFDAVTLDNGLVRATVLPGLGGHVLSFRDLVNDREVFHYNVPLKFGLIAIRGAWWAGGVEFNFPQVGHSIVSSDTVSWHVRESEDGSATVFVGGVENVTRMAWTVGLTIRPQDLRLHAHVWLFNRTPFWNRMYFWSNAAVPAREDYRFLLPATQVYSWWYSAKGVASYPIHEGRDLSRYTSHHRPSDVFAKDLRSDWFGCYYDDLDAGIINHASRFDVQGRKFWTWGVEEDAKVWARILCESAEPYIEIQSGRFVHQGLQRLIGPHAVEEWRESWAPVWGLGGVVHASDAVVLNAQQREGSLEVKLFALAPLEAARLTLKQGEEELLSRDVHLNASESLILSAPLKGNAPVDVAVSGETELLLSTSVDLARDGVCVDLDATAPYTTTPDRETPQQPQTASAWLLKAREYEQHNQMPQAAGCYRKALDLDCACADALAGLAQFHLKRGELRKALDPAEKALGIDPENEEAMLWCGLAGYMDAEDEGAHVDSAHLWALRRSLRYAPISLMLLGKTALRRREYSRALDLFEHCLERNSRDSKTFVLAAFAARKRGQSDRAEELLDRCEEINPLEPLLWPERYFAGLPDPDKHIVDIERIMEGTGKAYLEGASDYAQIWAWEEVSDALAAVQGFMASKTGVDDPMLDYYRAWALWKLGNVEMATGLVKTAALASPAFVFPHRFEDAQALEYALRLVPGDAMAGYLMGTWLASVGRWDEALPYWTAAAREAGDGELALLARRNIALMKWLHQGKADEAFQDYLKAIDLLASLRGDSAIAAAPWFLWLECDSVLQRAGRHAERAAAFESAPEEVKAKTEVEARWAEAYLKSGEPEKAAELLTRCNFKPWECEVRSRRLWKGTQMQLGHKAMGSEDYARAVVHFEAAASYPDNLNVGRPAETDDADALFWAGWCALQAGDRDAAYKHLRQAAAEIQPENAQTREFKLRAKDLLLRLDAEE